MQHMVEDSQWQGFEHQPQNNQEKTLFPFPLPSLSRTFNSSVKKQINLKPIKKEDKQQITDISRKIYPKIPIIKPKNHNNRNYEGTLIYQGFDPNSSDKYFNLKNQEPQKQNNTNKVKENLIFNSQFECGNLNTVYKIDDNNYNLHMRVDTNTRGHLQWFYFQVKNKNIQKITFTIFRFKKKFSLYQRGMKPYVKSMKQKVGWRQAGENISYWNIQQQKSKSKYYALTFTYFFRYENDQILIAACPPYSYSLLNSRLQQFATHRHCKVQYIGETLGGLKLPLVTFGNQQCNNYIVVLARTHPGQTSGSWVVDGLMAYLSNQKSRQFLKKITFKIIPMGNPDGVYIGNYRTGIIGRDFNRSFNQNPSSLLPQISQIKSFIKSLQKKGKILLFLDLHGHSIQKNSFIFGPQRQVFPSLFKQLISDLSASSLFKQSSCKFKTRSDCLDTARGYFQNVKKMFALTIQSSLGLYQTEDQCTYPILPEKWRLFGKQLAKSIQNAIETHFSPITTQNINESSEIMSKINQLQIINKKIAQKFQKIQKRTFTQKSQSKDEQRNSKVINKKKFEMIRWKKVSHAQNESSISSSHNKIINVEIKKNRKFSQQIDISVMKKQDINLNESKTSKNQSVNQQKRKRQFRSEKRPSTNVNPTEKNYVSQTLIQSAQQLSWKTQTLNGWDEEKRQIQVNQDNKTQIKYDASETKVQDAPLQIHQQQQLKDELANLSNYGSQSSDLNDRQNDSDDLELDQLKSLFHTVQIINKNRLFQFEFQPQKQQKRINKLKQVVQKRINKHPSYHSVPQKMQVYNKFNQLKLNVNNTSMSLQKKSLQQQMQTNVLRFKNRKSIYDSTFDFQESNNPSVQLSSVDPPAFVVKKQQIVKRPPPLIIPSYKTPVSNVYRSNLISQTLKQQLLVETSKRLQTIKNQSIFSAKPFEDTFLLGKSKSKFIDSKKKK